MRKFSIDTDLKNSVAKAFSIGEIEYEISEIG